MDAEPEEKKTAHVNVRVRPALKARLQRVYDLHRVGESDFVEEALELLCDYVEREQRFRRPMVVIHADQDILEMARLRAAEERQAHYGPSPMVKRLTQKGTEAQAAKDKASSHGPTRAERK